MSAIETDVLLVGSGLGATVPARSLARSGYRVALVPGIGSTRSAHTDGGVVEASLVEAGLGPGAPLGKPVMAVSAIELSAAGTFTIGEAERLPSPRRYQRSALERWAMERAVEAGALFLDDFVEGVVLPDGDDGAVLTSERDDRQIRARVIALCEGADPRIALRVGLRPDYGPEDQLHFARLQFPGQPVDGILRGPWRTSWGMPVEVMVTPGEDGTLVSVVARIENIMRANRSSADALRELISSSAFDSLGIEGSPGEPGMELVALRRQRRSMTFVHDRLLMGIDCSGVIDPRRIDRAGLTTRAGLHLAAYLAGNDLRLDGWPEMAGAFVRDAVPAPGAYHDEKSTGYLEDGAAGPGGRIAGRITRLLRPGRRTMTNTR